MKNLKSLDSDRAHFKAEVLQALQDLTKRLAESGEFEHELRMWGSLVLPPSDVSKQIDGTFDLRRQDQSTTGYFRLLNGKEVAMIVASGPISQRRARATYEGFEGLQNAVREADNSFKEGSN